MSTPLILVVEPDVIIRHGLAEYLRECGYHVAEAVDTDEAMKVISSTEVMVDVVLVDARSPGAIDGFGLSRWIRENRPDIQVVMGATVEKAVEQAADLCAAGPMLSKPYDHQLLHDHIKSLLASRSRRAPSD